VLHAWKEHGGLMCCTQHVQSMQLQCYDRSMCLTVLQVLVFDESGQRVGAPQSVSGCFVCSLDIHTASDLLLVGGEGCCRPTTQHASPP
jgi:hypothetical protein